jgi:hypothetical protein
VLNSAAPRSSCSPFDSQRISRAPAGCWLLCPGIDIHLHPLVVLSLADHWTRERCARGAASARCVGLLFGQQSGRTVHVLETVEMAYRTDKANPDQPILEQEAVETDMELCQSMIARAAATQWRFNVPSLLTRFSVPPAAAGCVTCWQSRRRMQTTNASDGIPVDQPSDRTTMCCRNRCGRAATAADACACVLEFSFDAAVHSSHARVLLAAVVPSRVHS